MLQIFEHQRLLLSDTFKPHHLNALLRFNDLHGNRYFTAIHRGVKFGQYVGVLQVGDLTIEVLPKADVESEKETWRQALLQMLHYCKLVKLETLSNAPLMLSQHSLLDIYIYVFLNEAEKLLRQGLIKKYQTVQHQSRSLRGQILFQKHITQNLVHKERFYTQSSVYELNHLIHQVLVKALKIIKQTTTNPSISSQCRQLLINFPEVDDLKISKHTLENIVLNKKTRHYKSALDIAKLILLNYCPDLKSGSYDILAILFDMNKLFEQYIFHALKRLTHSHEITVKGQPSERFWQQKTIRPDIFIQTKTENFVIDTKWKVLKHNKPHDDDLKQMYVYGQYFEAAKGLLVYPKTRYQSKNFIEGVFSKKMYEHQKAQLMTQSCDLRFVEILKDGKLNKNIGVELINSLKRKNQNISF